MDEFIVNEQGCQKLIQDMYTQLAAIQACVSQIDSHEGLMRSALGEDYEAIARSTRAISAELQDAQQNMRVVAQNMEEYIQRVGQIRVALNG